MSGLICNVCGFAAHRGKPCGPHQLKTADRPPIEGQTVSVRLKPTDRAKLEELQAHYGLDLSETLRTCVDVTHRTLTALLAEQAKKRRCPSCGSPEPHGPCTDCEA